MTETPTIHRPVINIDLDGVVYDFNDTLNQFIVASGRLPHPDILGNTLVPDPNPTFPYPQIWDYWEEWGMSKGEWFNWIRRAVSAGAMWRYGNVIEWAQPALWVLSDAEYHIRLVTTRLVHFGLHKEVLLATSQWLHDNNIPYRSISFVGPEGKSAYQAEIMVDDNVGNLVDWCFNNQKPGIIYDQPWNRDVEPFAGLEIQRAEDWLGVVELVKELVPHG